MGNAARPNGTPCKGLNGTPCKGLNGTVNKGLNGTPCKGLNGTLNKGLNQSLFLKTLDRAQKSSYIICKKLKKMRFFKEIQRKSKEMPRLRTWEENKKKVSQGWVPRVDFKKQNETNECCVCLEETKRTTSCGHPLCEVCIKIMVKGLFKRNASCPLCRKDLISGWEPLEKKCKPATRPRGRPKKVQSVGTAGMMMIGL